MSITGQPLDGPPAVGFGQHDLLVDEARLNDLIGESGATRRLRQKIDRIGPHFRTLLLQGEIGTGKELTARALHARCGGTQASFIHCHGAALADSFDRERYFSAGSPWLLMRACHNGTIFLDSIDEMPLVAQSRLLEILNAQMRGRSCMKMIAATCRNLEPMVAAGLFRPALYHHLAAIEIVIEPLRKRREDIFGLAHHMVRRFSTLYGKDELVLADDTLRLLEKHDWPGNIRELENILRNAVLACDEETLEPHHLNIVELMPSFGDVEENKKTADITRLQDVVERHVMNVLRTCSGNKVRAAELLGISRSTLYRMLENSSIQEDSAA
jgi:DNA-binding NtrC family response regulator